MGSEWGDEECPESGVRHWLPKPLGVVTRSEIYRSTALLFKCCTTSEVPADRFGESLWSRVRSLGH